MYMMQRWFEAAMTQLELIRDSYRPTILQTLPDVAETQQHPVPSSKAASF